MALGNRTPLEANRHSGTGPQVSRLQQESSIGTATVVAAASAAAVSATKPHERKRLCMGELCIALYRPKHLGSRIWWPALRFHSIQDFQTMVASKGFRQTNNGSNSNNNINSSNTTTSKSLNWSCERKYKKGRKRLVSKVLKECLSGSLVETLCYLGRPLEDYVTADDALKHGIQVQDFHQGLAALSQQARNPKFPGLFSETERQDQIPQLFRDYYIAMDEAKARHNEQDDDDDSDSDSDSDDEEESSSWASKAQEKWEHYQNIKNADSEDEEDEPHQVAQHQQQQQLQQQQHQNHDEVSVAQSAAAVSYTEASLMSASKAASVVSPPRLSEHSISKDESFDSIVNKHEMEGWDIHYNEDVDEMVYDAPNGCSFSSGRAFCEYLMDTYGFCGTDSPMLEHEQQQPRGRSRSRSSSNDEYKSSSRSRSRSRSREPCGPSWNALWMHLHHNLGWTYDYPRGQDLKLYGMNTSALWFRPGFDTKHRGELGRDHFVSEDSVLSYCQEHNIQVLPTPHKDIPEEEESEQEEEDDDGDEEEEEMEDDEPEQEDAASSSSSTHYVAQDDAGYATPDDQSTVPQDPGKPRLPSPSGTSASSSSGGSIYSYDNDPDRYVFSKLWQRLKSKGWAWCKAKNSLEDYWYVKPASIRPESEWKRGLDYFGSEEEVIDFCKQRDELSMKEREKRRKERLKRRQEEREVLANKRAEETTDKAVEKPKKKRGRQKQHQPNDATETSRKVNSIDATGTTKKQGLAKKKTKSNNESENAKKLAKKQRTKRKKKAKTKPQQREGFSCEDDNLRVDFYSRNGLFQMESPWVKDMPRYEHKVCLRATGVTWSVSYYYLPGETSRNYTTRFQNVGDVALHLALNPSLLKWKSGENSPSNEDEKNFERLIRYALVPGLQSAWSEIRLITRTETSFLLRKLGYESNEDASWEPPDALVATGHLEKTYPSLELLCRALRSLNGDLQTPPSATTRRRKQESSITSTQLMALRLRLAEDFSESEVEIFQVDSESESEGEVVDKKRKRGQSKDLDSEPEAQFYESPSDEKVEESQKEEENQMTLTPSEKKVKEFGEDEDQQIAMSPSKIKVGKFRKNPQDNTAPWRVNPHAPPKGGWHHMYLKMGMTYQNNEYYLPGESSKNNIKKFSRTEEICVHICEEGNYGKYFGNLDSKEQKLVKRHFDYANVPGNFHDWRKLRELDIKETVLFLNLLGFERSPGEYGWWQIPDGVPILEQRSYPTFSELCKNLIRLPDLEDRSMGMARRRRSRKKEEDQLLSDYQMMALRLRLAEGFGEEAESVAEAHQISMEKESLQQREERSKIEEEQKGVEEEIRKQDEANKSLFDNIDDLFDQLKRDKTYDVWKSLCNLGCTYSPGIYRIPGHNEKISTQQTTIEIILEKSVGILNWERCTLDAKEIANFLRYLKAFHIRSKDFPHIKTALKMATKNNIRKYLEKIGAIEQNGEYVIHSNVYSESDIVNMIRRTEKLSSLRQNTLSPVKRRRSCDEALLSELQQLSLRLWAILSDIPLTNMPEEAAIGRANREGKETQEFLVQRQVITRCIAKTLEVSI